MRLAATLTLTLLAAVSPLTAQEPPTGAPNKPGVQAPLLDTFRIGQMAVAFERTPLDSLRRTFGAGQIRETGDAGDYRATLCYTLPDSPAPSRLRLASTEMGGSAKAVMSLELDLLSVAVPSRECPALAGIRLGLPHGLRLLQARAEVLRLLGPPKRTSGSTLVYESETHDGEWTTECAIDVVLRGDRVVSIHARRVTSN